MFESYIILCSLDDKWRLPRFTPHCGLSLAAAAQTLDSVILGNSSGYWARSSLAEDYGQVMPPQLRTCDWPVSG